MLSASDFSIFRGKVRDMRFTRYWVVTRVRLL